MEGARDLFWHGQYDDAKGAVESLLHSLDALTIGPSMVEEVDPIQPQLLRASALTLLARARAHLRDEDQAERDFEEAVRLFSGALPRVNEGAGQYWRDYGIGLARLYREEEAFEALQRAVDSGVADAETYRYLGFAFRNQGKATNAETYFRRSLELAPDDPVSFELLAEHVERQGRANEAAALYTRAAALSAGRDVEHALQLVERGLAVRPVDASGLRLKADLLRMLERYAEALETADQALAAGGPDALVLTMKGLLLTALGRPAEGIDTLNQVLAENPDFIIAVVSKADALRMTNQLEEARQVVAHALALSPNDMGALNAAATIASQRGAYTEALEIANRVLAFAPTNSFALTTKVQAAWALGDVDTSGDAAESTLQIEPDNVLALAIRGGSLISRGEYEAALVDLDRALIVSPDYLQAMFFRGEALRLLGRFEEALPLLDQVLAADPTNHAVMRIKGDVLLQLGHPQEALELLNAAAATEPNDPIVLASRGEVLRMMERNSEALLDLEVSVSANPDYAFAQLSLARTLADLDRPADAVEHYERALALSPDDMSLRVELADALVNSKRWREAVEHFRTILSEREDVPLLRRLWSSLAGAGRLDEAIEAVDRAIELDPNSPILHADRAYLLGVVDRVDEAEDEVEAAVAGAPDDVWVRTVEGHFRLLVADYGGARTALEVATKRESTGWAWGMKGWVLQWLAESETPDPSKELLGQARRAYEQARAMDPGTFAWQAFLGDIYRLQADEERAIDFYQRTVAAIKTLADQADGDALNTRGWCHYQMGEYEDAIGVFVDSLSLDPTNLGAQFNLALAALRSGNRELGLREYQRGIEGVRKLPSRRRQGQILGVAIHDLWRAIKESPPSLPPVSKEPWRLSRKAVAPKQVADTASLAREAAGLLRDALRSIPAEMPGEPGSVPVDG